MKIGELEVLRESRQLLRDGVAVRMSSRAFDLLQVLLDAEGAIVPTEEILQKVWPATVVEENNIQVHICTLRRVLGEHRHLIQTVSGRGYRMSRPRVVAAEAVLMVNTPSEAGTAASFPLPHALGPLVGRERCVERVLTSLHNSGSVVTLTGPAGVGKSRLAIEVAHRLGASSESSAGYLSLAEQPDQANQRWAYNLIGAALEALGDMLDARNATSGMRGMLVIDNADLQAEAVAQALSDSTVFRLQTGIVVIVTSRTPLKVSMETVIQLPSLLAVAAPGEDSAALQMFVSRVRVLDPQIEITESFLRSAQALVEEMDGLPLAIELAAYHTSLLGIDSVRHLLQQNVDLPGRRMRRMAESRHESLGAALMWTWRNLAPSRQTILAGLIDSGTDADLRELSGIAERSGLSLEDTLDAVSGLVDSSFIFRKYRGTSVSYTIPNTVRRFLRQHKPANPASRPIIESICSC
ncbi:DNA-binding winged helix-turn-helix (wHTH) protein/predicted ATPase [Paraburkholderia sp. GAS199]|uniref:ATP-binding protein n=1 Tax=Paraburkholderia sp. GAS199 TaxID=3035126 RepID=UPI003D198E9E